MFRLLHRDRTDRHLLDERETHNVLAGADTVPHYHFHVVVRHNARRMDTSNRDFPHEVSKQKYSINNNVRRGNALGCTLNVVA